MAFQTSKPNAEFPFYGVSLVTSPNFKQDSIGAQVVLKLEPYNIINGQIVRPTKIIEVDGVSTEIIDAEKFISVIYSDAYESANSDASLAQALTLVSQGIQAYIDAKGI